MMFTLVTVPVEYKASSRALAALERHGILDAVEIPEIRRVLHAEALTYVASAAQVFLVLTYLISLYNRD